MSAIFERISIRKYEKKSVSDEMIKKIIEAGCAAPSAGNQQPWQFYVVKNNEILEKLPVNIKMKIISKHTGICKQRTIFLQKTC